MEVLKAEALVPARNAGEPLVGCFAADLMSDVLAFAREGSLLITGLITDQTIRTAAIMQMVAVVVVEGKQVGADMVEAAREHGVAVYRTPLSKFESCGLLLQAGLRPSRRCMPTSTERSATCAEHDV